MYKPRPTLLVLTLGLFISLNIGAQDLQVKDSLYVPKKKIAQQYDYENHTQPFPAKKKDQWAFGVFGGVNYMIADVWSQPGWAAGLRVQKALGHVFSIRMEGQFAQMKGQDFTPRIVPGLLPNQKYYGNYRTNAAEILLEGVASLNNINFYNKNPKVLINVFAGGGVMFSETKTNMLDENGNPYDYSSVSDYNKFSDRTKIKKELRSIQDKTYETAVITTEDKSYIKGAWKVNPAITVGAGLLFKLTRLLDLSLENRIAFYNTDWLDGTKYTRQYYYSGSSDIINTTTVGLNFKIGKAAEPRYWVNPLISIADNVQASLLNDDQTKNDIKKLKADLKPSDLDGDGVPDNRDAEPFSPKGATVDARGVAIDTDKDGVPDIIDIEPTTPNNTLVDVKGREIAIPENQPGNNTSNIVSNQDILGTVFFDLNRSEVKREFFPELIKVSEYLKKNPGSKVMAVGHTDPRASNDYNFALSKTRILECMKILNSLFGIEMERIISDPRGESDQMIPNLNDKLKTDDGRYYLNRRVDFKPIK